MLLVGAGASFTGLSLAAGIFMYISAAQGLPLMDANLAAVDRAIGFDWPSFLATVTCYRMIASVLLVTYHTTGPQIPALFLFLGMTLRQKRLVESRAR